mgnify:CR=1 FL=1
MPDNWKDSFAFVWNVSSGVHDDKNSRISRFVLFGVLAACIGLVCFLIYRGTMPLLSFGKRAIRPEIPAIISDRESMNNLLNQSQAAMMMQTNAQNLANSMATMNRRLFTDDPEDSQTPENLAEIRAKLDNLDNVDITSGANPEKISDDDEPNITIKALLLSGKNNSAVIDTNGKKGILVRVGTLLPDSDIRVIRVNSRGIKLRSRSSGKVYDCVFAASSQ